MFEKLGIKFEKLGKKFEKLGKKFEKIGKKFSLRLVINLKYGLDSTLHQVWNKFRENLS